MTFPSPRAIAAGNNNSSVTSRGVQLPATIQAGDRVTIWFACRNGAAVTWDNSTAGAWTAVHTSVEDANAVRLNCYSKIADGSEAGLTLTVTTDIATRSAWAILPVAGGDVLSSSVATNQGNTSHPDPPNMAPGAGAQDFLWVTVVATREGSGTDPDAPPNYTSTDVWEQNGNLTGGVGIGIAYRTLNASSENPGTWDFPTSHRCVVGTYALRGGSQTITLPVLSATSQLFAPQINPGIALPAFGPLATLFAPTVVYDQVLELPLLGPDSVVFAPIIVEKEIGLGFIPSTATLFEPTVTVGAAVVELPLLEADARVFKPLVTGGDRTTPVFTDLTFGAFPGAVSDAALYDGSSQGAAFQNRWDIRGPIGFGDFTPFVAGEYEFDEAFVWMRLTVEPVERVFAITRAKLNVDVPDVIDSQEVDVPEDGAWITFVRHFYQPPNVVAQVIAAEGVTTAPRVTVRDDIEVTRFFVTLHYGDDITNSVAGRIKYIATGY